MSGRVLQDIRILDLTSVIFGPYATATLAAMGANVIKIEAPQGDESRRAGKAAQNRGMSPLFMTLNEGKKSVVLDLKSEEARTAIDTLVQQSDVFVHSLRASAAARLGLAYERVRELRDDIIYVHCTGFGSSGAYAGQPAYDDIIQAASGTTDLLARAHLTEGPRYLPTALADKVAGLHAVYAVTGALFHRERTGHGQFIEVPMFEAVTRFMLLEHLSGHVFVPPNGPLGYARQLDRDRRPMRTADGYVSVAPYTDDRWVKFFEVAGRPDFLELRGWTTARLRAKNLEHLYREMADILPSRSSQQWLDLFSRHDIPAARANSLEGVLDDPHLSSVDFFQTALHPTEGSYRSMRHPVRFEGDETALAGAPALGEHTEEVLGALLRGDNAFELD